jgi:hypothetical protein
MSEKLVPGYGAWIKTFGIFIIIGGAGFCLTIIGALIGVPYIISGIKVLKSADTVAEITKNMDDNDKLEKFVTATSSLRTGFKIYFISSILMFVLYILLSIVAISVGIASISGS